MAHIWTPEDETALGDLINQGMNYPAIAEWFRANEAIPEATSKAVSLKAQALGINPGARGRDPRPVPVPPEQRGPIKAGLTGGVRFSRHEIPVRQGDRIVVLSDMQIPYQDEKTIAAVSRFMDDFEPNVIVADGDILDFYGLSTFTHNPLHASDVQNEIDIYESIFAPWSRRFPTAARVLLCGNHEDRLRKYIWENVGFASLRALDMEMLLSVGGTWKVLDYGSHVKISDTLIVHGDKVRQKAGQSAQATFDSLGMSVIMGHTHRASQASHRNARGQHVMIENGCLCRLDPEYAALPNWTQAFTVGYVNNGSVHWYVIPILEDGFRAEGRFYKRER